MENPRIVKPHSHESNCTSVEVAKVRSQMKQSATTSKGKPHHILTSALSQTSNDVRAEIGKSDTLKRSIRRAQRGNLPKDPQTLGDLSTEGKWTETSGRPFLIHDSGTVNKRVVVFATDEALRHLSTQNSLLMVPFLWHHLCSSKSLPSAPNLVKQLLLAVMPCCQVKHKNCMKKS